ncbi:iron chelate uptake ABC transporter family permease subunit [Brachybacterium sp. EF45031]|uniref:ABC transporter permease n=1 Tax=Brachybacterium sillae TaxID=2810536 RepID=UPI00217D8360|nr:iron chelate uptake ABC transporter family permease subunit [Brachybacterium sillae]MCS6711933.1 iron chelate uptake ABC transporter family permease subunit [Brachybacterium sillae]
MPGSVLTAPARPRRVVTPALLLAGAGVLALLALSLVVGAYDVFGQPDGWEMFLITRVPRTLALVLAGATMALSGVIMQLLTQNRFVAPTTTGTTEWAGLGLLLVTITLPQAGLGVRMGGAVLAAFVGTMVFFLLLRRVALTSSLVVPIIGIMLGTVVSALTTYLALLTDTLQNLGIWFAGSFTAIYKGQYELLWLTVIVAAVLFLAADQFTVAGLGREVATSVGLSYERVMLLGTVLVALGTGVTTVIVGYLPFLGLIVPNVVAMARGDDLRSNLPWIALTGTALVAACDILGRIIRYPFEIPVSLILGLVGAVVFIVLLLRQRPHG